MDRTLTLSEVSAWSVWLGRCSLVCPSRWSPSWPACRCYCDGCDSCPALSWTPLCASTRWSVDRLGSSTTPGPLSPKPETHSLSPHCLQHIHCHHITCVDVKTDMKNRSTYSSLISVISTFFSRGTKLNNANSWFLQQKDFWAKWENGEFSCMHWAGERLISSARKW